MKINFHKRYWGFCIESKSFYLWLGFDPFDMYSSIPVKHYCIEFYVGKKGKLRGATLFKVYGKQSNR